MSGIRPQPVPAYSAPCCPQELQLKRLSLCCRGAIVDTDDLVEALESGKLQGYGGRHLSALVNSW